MSHPGVTFVSKQSAMEQKQDLTVLDRVEKVYVEAKNCQLNNQFFKQVDEELAQLAGYFKITKRESFLMAMIFGGNSQSSKLKVEHLIDYLDCNPISMLKFNSDIEKLADLNYISLNQRLMHFGALRSFSYLQINPVLIDPVLQNKPLPKIQKETVKDPIDVLHKLYHFACRFKDRELHQDLMYDKAETLIDNNTDFALFKEIQESGMKFSDQLCLLLLIWKSLCGYKTIHLDDFLENIYEQPRECIKELQKITSGESDLTKMGWAKLHSSGFVNNSRLKLAEKTLNLLKQHDIHLFQTTEPKNLIGPDSLPKRNLIFNAGESENLNLIDRILKPDQFAKTQNQLKQKAMPTGVTVLFHGKPGTGKTEAVKQLARKHKRALMKVDISQSKSKFFGESEKVIQKIFTDYKTVAETEEKAPILLFNEADALISKRTEINNSNTAQTENAIQNVLLEELENFEGILVATTNLIKNFDPAFERRFLFKIKFNSPNFNSKQKIWQLKIPDLSDDESANLAESYDLSGGQIDNVVRKCEIQEIIYGKKTEFIELFNFCDEESLGESKKRPIGFSGVN